MVRVEGGRIADRCFAHLRPPRPDLELTDVHGIAWEDVARSPTFGERRPSLRARLSRVEFLAAHNASFDRSVLFACRAAAGVRPPRPPFVCPVQLARRVRGVFPTSLPDVCRRLCIPRDHHDALSYAEALARIVLAAERA